MGQPESGTVFVPLDAQGARAPKILNEGLGALNIDEGLELSTTTNTTATASAATVREAPSDERGGDGLGFGAEEATNLTRGGAWIAKVGSALALLLGVFHYWTGYSGGFPFFQQRSFHLGLALTVLLLGVMAAARGRYRIVYRVVGLACIALVVSLMAYIFLNDDYVIRTFRTFPTPYLIWAGLVVVIGLELARRVVGPVLPGIVLVVAMLILTGSYWNMPWSDYIASISFTDMVNTLGFKNYGIMGSITGVSAGIVGSFLVFGAMLSVSGGSQSFLDLARFLVGRFRGGTGKVSLLTSAFFGTVSGSAVANVVVDGVFTIPLMKRSGFRANFTAAVEATTSAGGQLVPPVMGASAFIMAELLGIPYSTVVITAIVPIFLFYVGLFIAIHIESVKQGIPGIPKDQLPRARSLVSFQIIGSFILPITMMLVTMYVWGRSILFASFVATSLVIVYILFFIKEPFQDRVKRILGGFRRGGMDIARIVAIVFTAQILISLLSMSGIASRAANELARASIPTSLSLAFLAAVVIVLGFGVPTAAAYVLAASIATPIFFSIGLEPIVGHMFILYFTVYANVTPPVMPATYAAVAIAKSDMMRSAIEGTKLMMPLVIVPFAFAIEPGMLLGRGTLLDTLWGIIRMSVGMGLLAAGLAFWLFRPLRRWEGVVLSIGAFLFAWPTAQSTAIGIAIVLIVLVPMLLAARRGDFNVVTTGAGIVRIQADQSVETTRGDEWSRTLGQMRAAFHGVDLPSMQYEVNRDRSLIVASGLTGASLAALVAANQEGAVTRLVSPERWPLSTAELADAGLAIVAAGHTTGSIIGGPFAIRPVELEMNIRSQDPADSLVERPGQTIDLLPDVEGEARHRWRYASDDWDEAVRNVARSFEILPTDRILIWHDHIYHDHLSVLIAFAALANDAVVVLDETCPAFDPARWLAVVEQGEVTTAIVPNERLAQLVEHVRTTGASIATSLSAIVHGGPEPLDAATMQDVIDVFGPITTQYVVPGDDLVGTIVSAKDWIEREHTIGRPLNEKAPALIVDDQGNPAGRGRLAFRLAGATVASQVPVSASGDSWSAPTSELLVTDLAATIDREGYVHVGDDGA